MIQAKCVERDKDIGEDNGKIDYLVIRTMIRSTVIIDLLKNSILKSDENLSKGWLS